MIFIGVLVAGGFLAAFIWAVRSGQYDDDYSPSVRILFDGKPGKDEKEPNPSDENPKTQKENIKPKQQ